MEATRYLVIGGDGLIGGALAHTLREYGNDCVRTSRRPNAGRERCVLKFDATIDDPADIPGDFNIAYLCAALTGFSACADSPVASRQVNVERTAAIAAALAQNGTFVVLPSTNAVFSQSTLCTDEACQPEPDTEYGRQKYEAEQAVVSAAGAARAAIVRLTKVIGLGSKLHEFLTMLRRHKPVHAFGDVQLSPITLQHAVHALTWVGRERCSGLVHVSGLDSHTYASIVEKLANEAMSDITVDTPIVEAINAPKDLVRHLYRPKRADLEMRYTVRRTSLRPQPLLDVIRYVIETSVPEASAALIEKRH